MKFKKGFPRPPGAGRKLGTPNRNGAEFKAAVASVFRTGGGEVWLLRWAKRHPAEFFQIAARLAPKEIGLTGDPDNPVPTGGGVILVLPDNGRGPPKTDETS